MVPVPISSRHSHHLVYLLLQLVTQYAPRYLHLHDIVVDSPSSSTFIRRASKLDPHQPITIISVVLIPVLVLLSGLFAGLTLGYMSLDETQLNVLSISGTPQQKDYANKIMPIRENGHLLLVTLLLANMIVNETLPVIADSVLGGGVLSVVVSTVLIVIITSNVRWEYDVTPPSFAEIIPQSLFTRHGLYLGAKMAGFTKCLIYALCVIAWPVAKILELALGAQHGIIYRRAELKELIAMHSSQATHGGDLKLDTVTIIGATLDLQEKVVKQAMTPISDVFMLSIDSQLDYALLKKICLTGHSRVPVYEEIDIPVSVTIGGDENLEGREPQKVRKIVGILLVKQCVLLDPKDATPLRNITLNKVPFVPNNEPLLGILDRFQEGRSHMAIVSRFSVEKAASVKKAVKRGLTQRLRERVGMGDSESDEDDNNYALQNMKTSSRRKIIKHLKQSYLEEGIENDSMTLTTNKVDKSELEEEVIKPETSMPGTSTKGEERKTKVTSFQLPKVTSAMTSISNLEQSMPADAVLAKAGAAEFLQGFDPAVMPLGIITLEDVLEELIGEEIYDEFDQEGAYGDRVPYESPSDTQDRDNGDPKDPYHLSSTTNHRRAHSDTISWNGQPKSPATVLPTSLKGLGFLRTWSAPPVPREKGTDKYVGDDKVTGREWDEMDDGKDGTVIQMPKPIKGTGRYPPSVILEQHSTISSCDTAVMGVEAKGLTMPPSTHQNLPTLAVPAPARLTPSAPLSKSQTGLSTQTMSTPPLEAILLERKRRAPNANVSNSSSPVPFGPHNNPTFIPPSPVPSAGSFGLINSVPGNPVAPLTAGGSVTPLTLRAVHSSGKGTMFKSSPLSVGDRASVEQVKAARKSDSGDVQSLDQEQREDKQVEKAGLGKD